jgi:hypothetical protein
MPEDGPKNWDWPFPFLPPEKLRKYLGVTGIKTGLQFAPFVDSIRFLFLLENRK